VEACAKPARSEGVRRAGQRGHRARLGAGECPAHSHRRPRRLRARQPGRAHRGRAGGPARRGHRRCVSRRGAGDLRPVEGSRAARELERLRQGVHGAPRHPHRTLRDVRRREGSARVRGRAGRAYRGEGGWIGGRQGRGRGDEPCRSACGNRRDARRQRDGGCGRARRRRGVPRRRGGELHRDGGRPQRAAARLVAGPQAPARRRPRAQYRRRSCTRG
jgi:hypothetical protein